MKLLDTHAHLGDSVFDDDRGAVLERARDAGVRAVITVGETLEDARKNLALLDMHPEMIRPTAGLYPTRLDLHEAGEIEKLLRNERQRLVAIGEVGLDHWKVKDEADREMQREIFTKFVDLSLELNLPLNVHSRSAGRDTIAVLLERGAKRVQLHAFDGKASTAQPAVEAGFFFSVPPSVVRSRQKQKLVKRLPLSRLLLETDSPVLGAEAGERNEPARVRVALSTVAEIQGISEEELAETVWENTLRLYGDLTDWPPSRS